ncbi:MAG TPA: hypothetical protein VG186_10760 [Solirubrobacteraceae bacterium]|nr:hypothetical protein [Solirubrobacteraceae bacterium]
MDKEKGVLIAGGVRRGRRGGALVSVGLALAIAGCGSSTSGTSGTTAAATTPTTTTTPATSATATTPAAAAPPAATLSGSSPAKTALGSVAGAERPVASLFPPARHRTLPEIGALAGRTAQLMPAAGVFSPGSDRYAFAVTASSGEFIYGPTALYLARSATAPASGPFLAPADPMGVLARYRSLQNAGPFGLQAIYDSAVPLPRSGTYAILALTRAGGHLIASPNAIAVAPSWPIPDVGQRPPAIATDTLASTGGKVSLLTTRSPPESMHSVSFRDVLGKRPIALLFSTPQLCTSKVCGPVTDLLVQAQHEFGSRVTFIHQEVFVDNDPTKGYRPQLKAFHLETEPWLFTINRQGVIAARLEGAFGIRELRRAIEAALA